MTADIVRKAFFTVAGSDKSDLVPGERSGGFGLAKMGFLLGIKDISLDTVRDGVRITVDPEESKGTVRVVSSKSIAKAVLEQKTNVQIPKRKFRGDICLFMD